MDSERPKLSIVPKASETLVAREDGGNPLLNTPNEVATLSAQQEADGRTADLQEAMDTYNAEQPFVDAPKPEFTEARAVEAASSMISAPPVATQEQLAASVAQTANRFVAPAPKPAEPLQDPNLREDKYRGGIQVVQGVQKPLN